MKQIFGAPISDYLPGLGFLAFTLLYLGMAQTYPPDARAFPSGVAWVMLGLTALDLLSRTKTPLGVAALRLLNPAGETDKPARGVELTLTSQIYAILWIFGFAALLVLIGVLYAVPVYAFSAMRFRGGMPYILAAAVTVLVTFLIWFLFGVILRINLYPGILFSGF